jgi:hypothetical protein
MDFAALTTAARSWNESDPAFLQIVRGCFDDRVFRIRMGRLRRQVTNLPKFITREI